MLGELSKNLSCSLVRLIMQLAAAGGGKAVSGQQMSTRWFKVGRMESCCQTCARSAAGGSAAAAAAGGGGGGCGPPGPVIRRVSIAASLAAIASAVVAAAAGADVSEMIPSTTPASSPSTDPTATAATLRSAAAVVLLSPCTGPVRCNKVMAGYRCTAAR